MSSKAKGKNAKNAKSTKKDKDKKKVKKDKSVLPIYPTIADIATHHIPLIDEANLPMPNIDENRVAMLRETSMNPQSHGERGSYIFESNYGAEMKIPYVPPVALPPSAGGTGGQSSFSAGLGSSLTRTSSATSMMTTNTSISQAALGLLGDGSVREGRTPGNQNLLPPNLMAKEGQLIDVGGIGGILWTEGGALDFLNMMQAYYKRVHGTARIQEELARNLNINVADVCFMERFYYKALKKEALKKQTEATEGGTPGGGSALDGGFSGVTTSFNSAGNESGGSNSRTSSRPPSGKPMGLSVLSSSRGGSALAVMSPSAASFRPSTAQASAATKIHKSLFDDDDADFTMDDNLLPGNLPPISYLVLRLMTCTSDEVNQFFSNNVITRNVGSLRLRGGSRRKGAPGSAERRRQAFTDMLDARNTAKETKTVTLHDEILQAIRNQDRAALGKWIGTFSVFLAAVAELPHRVLDKAVHIVTCPSGTEAFRLIKTAINRQTIPQYLPAYFLANPHETEPTEVLPLNSQLKVEESFVPPEEGPPEEATLKERLLFKLEQSGYVWPKNEEMKVMITVENLPVVSLEMFDFHKDEECLVGGFPFAPMTITDAMSSDWAHLRLVGSTGGGADATMSQPAGAATGESGDHTVDGGIPGFVSMAKQFFTTVNYDLRRSTATSRGLTKRIAGNFVRPHHCPKHTKMIFTHFCRVDRKLVCAACCREEHNRHEKTPITSFLMSEIARMEPKRTKALNRTHTINTIANDLPFRTMELHELIDQQFDTVLENLRKQRQELHDDVERRRNKQLLQIDRERRLCYIDKEKTDEAKLVVDRYKEGFVSEPPKLKPHRPLQIVNLLKLVLPTDEITKLVVRLDWSNPSKHLSSAVYP